MLTSTPKEVLILACENESDERALMSFENIDTLKEDCILLNMKIIKIYTEFKALNEDIENDIVPNIPVILWGYASDYPGLEQSSLDYYSHIEILPHLEMLGA
ncbi:hypothetical protein ACR0RE_09670 [Staphylococcus haemolyticus]|uniref:hypothetical protein n=1 Tax=Staphylococcus haemolyticus TaxID=1283 RepID=UPI000872F6B8|nr:hypothetical protein [Staphylococcus haemolyticus]MBF2217031.1 hypothetical protein [Staphylococcus haemolyticus]MBF2221921.1 hypothetical protein [Staphylococcus haemolyticus]MCH4507309.1 hypothetical protein [Staphylococcus haemolyticus]MCK6070308.1 hypothetical protein [Staphylococcus haemolyticus]MCK6112208.1 hypothetical protein [Staphylococcus haemolyticus]